MFTAVQAALKAPLGFNAVEMALLSHRQYK